MLWSTDTTQNPSNTLIAYLIFVNQNSKQGREFDECLQLTWLLISCVIDLFELLANALQK